MVEMASTMPCPPKHRWYRDGATGSDVVETADIVLMADRLEN